MPLTNNGYNLALSKRDFVQGLEESSKTSKLENLSRWQSRSLEKDPYYIEATAVAVKSICNIQYTNHLEIGVW